MLMKKAPTWLRTTLSLPVYAISAVLWIFTAYTIITSSVKMLSRYVTPQQIGQGLAELLFALVFAAVGSGLWMLARYIRTSNFKKQPRLSASTQS